MHRMVGTRFHNGNERLAEEGARILKGDGEGLNNRSPTGD